MDLLFLERSDYLGWWTMQFPESSPFRRGVVAGQSEDICNERVSDLRIDELVEQILAGLERLRAGVLVEKCTKIGSSMI